MKTRADETKSQAESRANGDTAVAEHKFDPIAFDAAIAKWYGFGRDRMLRLGFETTDEFMKAIRGR